MLSLVLCLALVGFVSGSISCLDQNGNPVDWWAMIKFPHGDGYAMYSNGHFTSAPNDLSSAQSALNQTFYQMYAPTNPQFGHVLYNDQTPDNQNYEDQAHQKGVIAFDSQQGFWLVHSVPRFPSPIGQGSFSFPQDEEVYGQSFLCMTMQTSVINEVAFQFFVTDPHIYDSNVPASLQSVAYNITSMINGKNFQQSYTNAMPFTTSGGAQFISFAKNKQWNNALYENLVCPYYQQGMQWETWRDGTGNMPSYCTPTYPYDSLSIDSVALQDGSGLAWKTTRDHSKWGVSTSSSNPIACIGDINRQTSQARRGGGTVCSRDPELFNAFNEMIVGTVAC